MTAWTEICRNCSGAIVFWQHRFFAIVCLRGILLGSLKMHKLFSKDFSNINYCSATLRVTFVRLLSIFAISSDDLTV